MKKYIFLIILTFISIIVKGQFTIQNQIVLPSLKSNDKSFISQLDSILFIKHPCLSTKEDKKYIYFMQINELDTNQYQIDIIYAKPSIVEDDVNTGIYKIDNIIIIITEDSNNKLFDITKERIMFEYKKELIKKYGSDREFIEIIYPEEVCTWELSYSKSKLNVINLERVKGASKYKKSDNQFPNLDFRISKE